MPSLDDYLTVRAAAAVLGVAPNTIRAWGAAGKLPEYRHPMNGYRLYRPQDLQAVLRRVESSLPKRSRPRRRPR